MPESMQEKVTQFLANGPYAVVGASQDRHKFGNKVLRSYLQSNKTVYPIHPKEGEIEGQKSYHSLADLPETVQKISVVTPPAITEKVVQEAIAQKVHFIWMQPGAESEKAIQ
ncbi:MAG: CoA-binding protein, partial [Simkania sp.]|nr:CoA-binding protein [Simkania sp.]